MGRTVRQSLQQYSRVVSVLVIAVGCATCGDRESAPRASDTLGGAPSPAAATAQAGRWEVRPLENAPPRFRPKAWSDEDVLWGLVGGRITRLDTRTGDTRTLGANGWWVRGAPEVIAWQNENGTSWMRDGGTPARLVGAGGDSARAGDGPSVLLSNDGRRALLGWRLEWDAVYDLVEAGGSARRVETRIPGYFGNDAVLWLDSTRVLFHTVANGPIGGEPTYRESGWRGDLAVLDLRANSYTRVTGVPDFTYLRVAGPYLGQVLVTERDTSGVRGHWLYDPRTWERRTIELPRGRAFSATGGGIVVFLDSPSDTTEAVLVASGVTTQLGHVARDEEPSFTPSGRRGALHTANGVILFERRP